MRFLVFISLFLSCAVGCRADAPLNGDAQTLNDMEDLAIEMVHILDNSWCEEANPGGRCYLAADGDVDITHVAVAHYDHGEYDVVVDGVLFGESELEGAGTVTYNFQTDEVDFSGLMSVNDSTMYAVDISVTVLSRDHYEVVGQADGVAFEFDLRHRSAPDNDDDGGCRTVELGIDCG